MVSIAAFGDNVVDCYLSRGMMFPGGNALNVACFARTAGATATYIGAIADDPAGRHIRSELEACGVDTSRLRILPGRTAYCVIGNRNGEREFLRADLGVSIIAPTPEDLDHISGYDAVHTGRSSHVDDHLPAMAECAELSFDFAMVRDAARIGSIAPHCFLASFSGGGLSDSETAELMSSARAAGAKWCLVTNGSEGATLSGPSGTVSVPAAPAEIVDTLGAGDRFIGRVLVGLLAEDEPESLMQDAARAAAETCARLGAVGAPAPIEIDESASVPIEEIYSRAAEDST